MSYAIAAALQVAVYDRLTNNAALTALVGNAVYDTLPLGTLPDLYVTLGPEDVRVATDKSASGAWHRFVVSVITGQAGFHAAKEVAGAISDALTDANMAMSRGNLAALHFYRARARREGTGALRRIDLTFRARVDDNPNS